MRELRSAAARRFRPVAIACVAVIALQFVLGGKAYYPGAVFTFLLAAGCVPLERRLAARPRAVRATPRAVLARVAGRAGHARGPGWRGHGRQARCWPRRWRSR